MGRDELKVYMMEHCGVGVGVGSSQRVIEGGGGITGNLSQIGQLKGVWIWWAWGWAFFSSGFFSWALLLSSGFGGGPMLTT